LAPSCFLERLLFFVTPGSDESKWKTHNKSRKKCEFHQETRIHINQNKNAKGENGLKLCLQLKFSGLLLPKRRSGRARKP
jgi:hypothetical protein